MATVIDAIIKLQDQMSDKLAAVNSNLKKTDRMAKATSKSISNMGKNFDKAASKLQPFAMAAVGTATLAINAFADLDTKHRAMLNKLEVETRKSTEISKQAFIDMSLGVAKPAEELINIANSLGGAIDGLSGQQLNKMTEEVAKFAIATDTASDVASNMVSNTVNAFKLPATEVPKLLDAITAASNYSSADVADLGEALSKCSTAAAGANQNVYDMSAALAVLANTGVKGSEAGTGLANIFERMANPANVENLTKIGVAVFDAQGKMRSLVDIAADFNEKTKGMSDSEKQFISLQTFGGIGARAFNQLAQNAEAYRKQQQQITDSQGAMNQAYEEMNQSLGANLQLAKNSGMAILYKIGEKLAPQVKEITDYIVDLSKKISRADDGTLDWVISIGKVVVGLFAFFKAASTTMSIVSTIAANMKTLRAVFSIIQIAASGLFKVLIIGIRAVATAFLTNPIGLAITAIIVVLMLLYYNWDTVKDYLIAGWNMLKNAINSVVNWFNGTLVPAWNDGINAIGNFFNNLWEGIKSGVSGAVSFIKEGINTIISALNGISFHIPDWVPNWGGKDFSLNIPLLFTGTENWKGGLAKIHDQGGEIIDLPSGTRVMPHDKSVKEAREMGRKEGAVNNRTNNSININKLADSIVVREEADIDKIISGLVEKLQVHAINTMEGAV
jgi:phage tail tape measure protein, TP901 family|nr:MAG TPA: minor tail protein [Caudoviricetes sp.]